MGRGQKIASRKHEEKRDCGPNINAGMLIGRGKSEIEEAKNRGKGGKVKRGDALG